MINLNPVTLAVRWIFTGVREFQSRSPKLGHVAFDLLHAVKITPRIDAHTKFELFSLQRNRGPYMGRPPSWIRPLVGFHNSAAFLSDRVPPCKI